PPATPRAQEGMKVFLERPCAMCHEVRGTRALASVGPDLTHLASRRTLAAGTLPNNRGSLAGWILNHQSLKPGAHMPDIELTSHELHSLLAFLETLHCRWRPRTCSWKDRRSSRRHGQRSRASSAGSPTRTTRRSDFASSSRR